MANITAAAVKELREMTGAGMMECKKALVEADGDMDGAVDVLRKRGLASAAKKAGRATNEGAVACHVCPASGAAGIVEVNCETDFVSGNEKYVAFANELAKAAAMNPATDLDDFMTKPCGEQTVGEALTEAIHIFGENMKIARFARITREGTGAMSSYIHAGGKIGVLVDFTFDNEATAESEEFKSAAKDIAMQVAAADPVAVDRDSVPADIIEHEMSIYTAQAAASGKPESIQEKIAQGRLNKYFKEFCLTEQDFVKDSDKSVQQYLDTVSKQVGDNIKIKQFIRFRMGETQA
ncbi:MAG: elongation factor Ts [Coriobacteriales bacterium]|jgi:elongation factor Ts|nr:elongation factor Ts [Coriobacteriales bacterium]